MPMFPNVPTTVFWWVLENNFKNKYFAADSNSEQIVEKFHPFIAELDIQLPLAVKLYLQCSFVVFLLSRIGNSVTNTSSHLHYRASQKKLVSELLIAPLCSNFLTPCCVGWLADDDYDDLWATLSMVRGSKMKMCRLVLLISDHPIQQGY